MKKKILIVGAHFYPENSPRAFRTTELAKEFAKRGNEVTVLVPKNKKEHFSFEKKHQLIIKDLGKPIFPKIILTSDNKFKNILKRILKRILLQFFEYPSIEFLFKIRKVLKNEKSKYDLLISIASPHSIHWGVSSILGKNKSLAKIWIADCGDPYMGTTTDTFKKFYYFRYIEKSWCKKVDFITVPFEGAIEGYYEEFRRKIRVIPQGFNFDEININSKSYKSNEIPTFAYAGLLIPGSRDPRPLINYLLELNINFKFIFFTNSTNMLSEYLEKSRGKIEIKDPISRKELINILGKMDFVINFDNGVPTQLPSKLIDYYLTKRPILSVNSFNFNKRTVNEFLTGDYTNKYQFNNPEKYRIEYVVKQFLDLSKI